MFGLSVDTLADIKKAIAQVSPIQKVLLYGSRAKGNYKKGSDLDFTLIGRKLNFKNSVYPLRDKLDDLYLPYKFDISIFKDLNDLNLVEHILRVGKILYQRKTEPPWPMVELGDVCEYEKIQKKHCNLIYVGLENIESNTGKLLGEMKPQKVKSSTFYFSENHVLYGRLRPYLNKVLIPKFKGHCSTEIFPIKIYKEIDKQYLARWLMTETITNKINETCTGTRMPRANMNDVLKLKIPLPPINRQKKIVTTLDMASSALDKAIAHTEKNLQNCREFFDSYIGQLLSNDDEKWPMVELGDVCEYEKIQKKHCNLIYVGLENIESNTGKLLGEMKPQKVKSSTFYFSENHVLYGRLRPYLNKVLIPKFKGHCSTEIFPIKAYKEIDKQYLARWLMTETITNKINETCTGTRMPRANMNYVLKLKIPLPPLKHQKEIVAKIDKIRQKNDRLVEIYQKKLNYLKELKQVIFQRVLDGEIAS